MKQQTLFHEKILNINEMEDILQCDNQLLDFGLVKNIMDLLRTVTDNFNFGGIEALM